MTLFQSIILGIVEGLTEFLPISSTFHLIFTAKVLSLPQTDFIKLFEVFIQSGAILSVFLLYFHTLRKDTNLLKKTLVAYVPTATIGFLLYKIIKNIFFESDMLMLTVFILVGILFIGYELYLKKRKITLEKTLSTFTYKQAIIVGLIQALSVVPGVSRAGAVLLAMMFLGFKRSEAAKFSFMLSIPTIFSASLFDLIQMRHVVFSYMQYSLLLAIGFIAAFLSSYIVVKWLIHYLQKHTLESFGIYRIVLGLLLFFAPK
jgi:undecaprenyl-diphosphatase